MKIAYKRLLFYALFLMSTVGTVCAMAATVLGVVLKQPNAPTVASVLLDKLMLFSLCFLGSYHSSRKKNSSIFPRKPDAARPDAP